MGRRLIILASLALLWLGAMAQDFSVASFRALPNDVSAFINPVLDLNGDACALIKVEACEDFAFSSPLGIIKRVDKTGEIWLYLPAKSKKITIKHPQWGVLRDYMFDSRLESHVSYEMRIDQPLKASRPVAVAEPIVITQIDPVVITQVDTMVIAPVRPKLPVQLVAMATACYGGRSRTLAGGLFVGCLRRHGGYAHISTDFGRVGAVDGNCGRHGDIDGHTPFYSGATRHSCLIATAGAMHRLSGAVAIYEGVGYGSNAIAWRLAPSEGGAWVKNSWYSGRGVAFEAGAMYSRGALSVSAGVASIRGRQWFGSLGVGFNFGVKRKKKIDDED